MPVLEDSCAEQTETPLQQYCLTGLKGLYYIPDYLDSTQQNCLLEDIRSSKSRWTQVTLHAIQTLAPSTSLLPQMLLFAGFR